MQHEDVTAVVWQDKRVVLLLSTNSDPRTDGSVTRKTGKGNEKIEIACPQAVINYTKHMGGVDVSDKRREYCGVGRSSKKWWKFILHFVLNVCLVNCFIYDLSNHPPPLCSTRKQPTDHQTKLGASADWCIHVSEAYRQKRSLSIGTAFPNLFHVSQAYRQKRSLPIGTAFPNLFHTLQKVSDRAKLCALCIEKKKKAPPGRGKQTTYKCKQCDLPLCRVGCFLEYHEQRNVEVQN